ncbi:hypothetical protein, similar to phosphatidate cytidylyltransferase cdsA (2.7.7.41), putative fragment [Alteracholeplasma palmae J233]|uniref:Phosphatidate cytidylyltransferase n=1 Tax=Alteracholeplasma palmae (strain ATCC 49389 / J233) TaxID=1318466 RepID=U4KL64_ALTPJ|nr:phosphatidate cytidylyltransferase CdsA [Alteracholeplasma palmae]CCV64629.1 hypothetical protein, similar to phosphatidate cytidylyltransferase cdsA (2.7.7.41), putative fragment [Alteracholeplasma palmae J233]
MNNIWGLILSFVLVFCVIGLAEILKKKKVLGDEASRKLIHIGVSNWWFLMFYFFDQIYYAIAAPIIFIILNYVSYKTNLIKSMERSGKGNLGTVYFPISLLLLVIASMTFTTPLVGGIGILVLGYGDGLAALLGKKFGKKQIINHKTWVGSITMFLVSFLVSTLLMVGYSSISIQYILLYAGLVGILATLIELLTPKGLDNLTLPLLISLLMYVLIGV